ncbi:DNA-binding protein [Burkholderia sp. Ac-20353]|nr:DNA-binding protein [Burkholderia sp. Ac-20353]
MQAHPLCLSPGDDVRVAVEEVLRQREWRAAFVIQGIGSLSVAQLRFAGAESPTERFRASLSCGHIRRGKTPLNAA